MWGLNDKYLRFYFSILMVFLLFISCFQIKSLEIDPEQPIIKSSNNLQNIELESEPNSGINVDFTSINNIKLSHQIKFFEDDFSNNSYIDSYANLTLDTVNKSLKLKHLENTFYKFWGSDDAEYGESIVSTTDGGYMITGAKMSISTTDYSMILLKIDGNGNELWNKTYGGGSWDWGSSVQRTKDGGYIIGGSTYSWGAGVEDFWLVKTDSGGNKIWDRTFGGARHDRGKSVQQTSDGGYIIGGYGNPGSYGAGGNDMWLFKTNETGIEQWNKSYGGINSDMANAVIQTNDNGFILTGDSFITEDILKIWVVKTNSIGDMEWNRTFNGYDTFDVQQTSDNGFIITGSSSGDVCLIKMNATGVEEWNKTYGGAGWDEFGLSCQETSDGGVIITGYTNSFGLGNEDLWLIKTDNSGNMQWNKTFGGKEGDRGWSIKLTNDGGYIIVGDTLSYGAGEFDILIIKTDENGNLFSDGNLVSKNLIKGENPFSINYFNCSVKEPYGSSIKVQFSQDKNDWFDPKGVKNNWYNLSNGLNTIDLSALNWQGSNFYYKMIFSTQSLALPILTNINLSFSEYLKNGYIMSTPFNAEEDVLWKNIYWKSEVPQGTNIKFQLKSSDSKFGLTAENYIGPDGTISSFYSSSGESLWNGHNRKNWIQYKAFLSTSDTSITPVLNNITISFKYIPKLKSPKMTPKEGDITTKYYFTVEYHDRNNATPIYLYVSIDKHNYTMIESEPNDLDIIDGKTYFFNTKISAGEHTYQYFASDGELELHSEKIEFYVEYGPLDQILVKPAISNISADDYIVFTAQGFDEDKNLLPIYPEWSVSGGGFINQKGNFTATTPGTWTIFANYSDISGNATINIEHGTIFKIKISPQLETITTDEYLNFQAKGVDADNNEIPIEVEWSVSGGGEIDQNGNFTANTPGEWLIYANSSNINGKSTIIVELGMLNKIKVFPNYTEINISEFVNFIAKGYDADNNELDIFPAWQVSGGGTIDISGKFKGLKPGAWTVYANKSGITGNAKVKVNDGIGDGRPGDKKSDDQNFTWLYVGVGIVFVLVIIIIFYLFIFKKKGNKNEEIKENNEPNDVTEQKGEIH